MYLEFTARCFEKVISITLLIEFQLVKDITYLTYCFKQLISSRKVKSFLLTHWGMTHCFLNSAINDSKIRMKSQENVTIKDVQQIIQLTTLVIGTLKKCKQFITIVSCFGNSYHKMLVVYCQTCNFIHIIFS